MSMAYQICKSLHLFSMVLWFSGTFALLRAFALHGEQKGNAAGTALLKNIELRAYKGMANPGLIGTWVFALAMIGLNPEIMKTGGWLHAKILIVFLFSGFMGAVLGKARKRFENDEIAIAPARCKLYSQIVLVVLLSVIFLAVARPF